MRAVGGVVAEIAKIGAYSRFKDAVRRLIRTGEFRTSSESAVQDHRRQRDLLFLRADDQHILETMDREGRFPRFFRVAATNVHIPVVVPDRLVMEAAQIKPALRCAHGGVDPALRITSEDLAVLHDDLLTGSGVFNGQTYDTGDIHSEIVDISFAILIRSIGDVRQIRIRDRLYVDAAAMDGYRRKLSLGQDRIDICVPQDAARRLHRDRRRPRAGVKSGQHPAVLCQTRVIPFTGAHIVKEDRRRRGDEVSRCEGNFAGRVVYACLKRDRWRSAPRRFVATPCLPADAVDKAVSEQDRDDVLSISQMRQQIVAIDGQHMIRIRDAR